LHPHRVRRTEGRQEAASRPTSALRPEFLAEHRSEVHELRAFAGARWQNHEVVGPSQVGTPLKRNVLRRFQKIRKASACRACASSICATRRLAADP
jgi:hypothetical protein